MAGHTKKQILDRFGKPDHESKAGNMWYFKQMLYIRNRKTKGIHITLLRIKANSFEYYCHDDNEWKLTQMQNIPMGKYNEFVEKQLEEILLDAPTESK